MANKRRVSRPAQGNNSFLKRVRTASSRDNVGLRSGTVSPEQRFRAVVGRTIRRRKTPV